jgi:hypothetical protein
MALARRRRFPGPTEIVSHRRPPHRGRAVAEGYSFSRRGAAGEGVVRIACAFDTTPEAVDALIATAERYAGMRPAAESAAAAAR